MNENRAYWNTSKCCWEIAISRPAGDRYEQTMSHANSVCQMLKDQGIKYVDAFVNQYQSYYLLLIADPEWYLTNEEAIKTWSEHSGIDFTINGMVLEFKSQEDKMMFMLRW
jgi:hypothetical protein